MEKCIENKGIRILCGKPECSYHYQISFASFQGMCCGAYSYSDCIDSKCGCGKKKVDCWDKNKNNNITPYHISKGSQQKYYFICNICQHSWNTALCSISNTKSNRWCPNCAGKTLKTQDIFIKQAKLKHNNKYIYDKTLYRNAKTKIIITCPIHGDWEQTPANHLNGYGCKKCGTNRTKYKLKLTLEEFIEKSINIHGTKYNYNNVIYINNTTTIEIICSIHGIFKQTPGSHLAGQGCMPCSIKYRSDYCRSSIEDFIQKSINLHGDYYDYSKVEYISSKHPIIVICKIHGNFKTSAVKHLFGYGCRTCGYNKVIEKNRLSKDEFIKRANNIHGTLYDYSNSDYQGYHNNISIICKIHGEFKMDPCNHFKGAGCYSCNNNKSSIPAREWLAMIQSGLKYKLQTNDSIIGEYHIPTTRYFADGYDSITHTIYEFYGSYWHGDPTKYANDEINKVTNTTMGELYHKTVEKKRKCIELGYKYIEIWESQWTRFKKIIKNIKINYKKNKK